MDKEDAEVGQKYVLKIYSTTRRYTTVVAWLESVTKYRNLCYLFRDVQTGELYQRKTLNNVYRFADRTMYFPEDVYENDTCPSCRPVVDNSDATKEYGRDVATDELWTSLILAEIARLQKGKEPV